MTVYDKERHDDAGHRCDRRPSCPRSSHASRRPVPCARSSSRSTTSRPARRAASRASSGRWRTAASPIPVDVRGRRGDRPDGRARPRLPQHRDGDGRATATARHADRQPLAADDGDGQLQRPRPASDDRPPRPGPAPHRPRAHRARGGRGHRPAAPVRSRPAGSPASASPPTTSAPGNAGLRLLSQLRFDIVKIDLRSSRAAPSTPPRSRSSGRCATWPIDGARWSSPRGSNAGPARRRALARDRRRAGLPARAGRRTVHRPSRSISTALKPEHRLADRPPAGDARMNVRDDGPVGCG